MFAEGRKKGRRDLQLFVCISLLVAIIAILLPIPALEGHCSQEQGAVQGLHINKYAAINSDGTYKITLESYTTGRVSVTQTARPVDIVLVLDTSNSMNDWDANGELFEIYSSLYPQYLEDEDVHNFFVYIDQEHPVKVFDPYSNQLSEQSGWINAFWCTECSAWTTHVEFFHIYYAFNNIPMPQWTPKMTPDDHDPSHTQFYSRNTRLSVLKTGATAFVNKIAQDAQSSGLDHRVALVSFNSTATTLQDLSSVAGGSAGLIATINGMTANSYTNQGEGLTSAELILRATPADREKVIIVFSDGLPFNSNAHAQEHGETLICEHIANDTIETAQRLKEGGTSIYMVGLLPDFSAGAPLAGNAPVTDRFMHYTSSNFPNAQSLTNPGEPSYPSDGSSYCVAVSNGSELEAAFVSIATTISGDSYELGSQAVVVDTVTQYFSVPAAHGVKACTQDYLGYDGQGNRIFSEARTDITSQVSINVDASANRVTVTGFDYNANCVTDTTSCGVTTYSGRKLVVEFDITPRDEFVGGNNVPTNVEASSGLYRTTADLEDNIALLRYELPHVNVPICELTAVAPDYHVYLLQDLSAGDLADACTVSYKGRHTQTMYTVTFDAAGKSTLGREDDYAEIVRTVSPTDGYAGLTQDLTYGLTATASSRYGQAQQSASGTPNLVPGPEAVQKEATDDGNIYVYKPVLTFTDSIVYFGDAAPTQEQYLAQNYRADRTDWRHGEGEDVTGHKSVVMHGSEPQLLLQFTPQEGISGGKIATTQGIAVEVTMKIGETSINNHASFAHEACPHETCNWPDCSWDPETMQKPTAFLLHVPTGTVTISKSVEGNAGDRTKLFAFAIAAGKNGLSALPLISGSISDSGEAVSLADGSFTLAHGQTIILSGVPLGAGLSVTEGSAPDYETTVAIGDDAPLAQSDAEIAAVSGGEAISFVNTRELVIDTGYAMEKQAPGMLLLLSAGSAAVFLGLLWRRRSSAEDTES